MNDATETESPVVLPIDEKSKAENISTWDGRTYTLLPGVREERPGYKYDSGSIYVGEWLGDKRDGKGVQTMKTGEVYEGGWVDDKAEGYVPRRRPPCILGR